ncbi:MAG: hypothetical protein AAGJ70_12045, partial [Pseudomonadota bacterium]
LLRIVRLLVGSTDSSSQPGRLKGQGHHAQIIKRFKSDDENSELEILSRDDGLFEFRGYRKKIEPDGPFMGDSYWSLAEHSGLYETAESAERDARNEVDWLSNNKGGDD